MAHDLLHQAAGGARPPESLNQEVRFLPNHGSRSCGKRQRMPIPGQIRRYRRRGRHLIVLGLPTGGGRFGPPPLLRSSNWPAAFPTRAPDQTFIYR
jgi:hypothetical protein